jgi:hypothetical protein
MRFAAETLGLQSTSFSQNPATTAATGLKPVVSPSLAGTSMDIRQFTAAKAPKTDMQFAAVAAYYYRFEAPEDQRKETIDVDSLMEAARLADRRRPTRYVLNNARNAGYLDAVSSGKYRINSVGENLVAVTLPGDGSQAPPTRGTRRNKSQKKNMPQQKLTKPMKSAPDEVSIGPTRPIESVQCQQLQKLLMQPFKKSQKRGHSSPRSKVDRLEEQTRSHH